jgi:putative acetyltransferase
VTSVDVTLRPYVAGDEDAAIELWRRTWQQAYPDIDFAARLAWWRERWNTELVPACAIRVARASGHMVGFVTVEPRSGYLDQIVVAPEAWGSATATALVDAAKCIAPSGLDLHVNRDNRRAIRFYEKHGFTLSGEDINPRSGAPILKMSWRP